MKLRDILPEHLRSVSSTATGLSDPKLWLSDFFGGPTKSGATVNTSTALGIPAFWRGVDLWSNTIGSLPLNVMNRTASGKEIARGTTLFNLLHDRPNEVMTSFQWRKMSQSHLCLYGNAYSVIEFDSQINPTALLPFHPNDVTPVWSGGKVWYQIRADKQEFMVDSASMLHIKGMWLDGLRGLSLVSVLKETLGLAIATQDSSATFYKKGSRLDGVITQVGQLADGGMKKLRKTWNDTFGNPTGNRVAFLDAGMDYKAISVDPEKSQMIEARKFSVTDISRIVSIPPPLLYDLEKATFSNITELIQSFEKFDLRPWLVNWEQELNWKLLKEEQRSTTFTKFNVDGLLRGDAKERAELHRTLFNIGAASPNEIRSKENMNSYKNGETKFRPLNMTPNDGTIPPQKNGQSAEAEKDAASV